MTTTIEELESLFDDHPSLNASLQDFEPGSSELNQSPLFGQHLSHRSGFKSDESDSEMADSVSGGGYSPPAWRRTGQGTRSSDFWNRNDNVLGKRARGSRESSAEYESADEGEATLAMAARTRLPTSASPSPYPTGRASSRASGGPFKTEDESKTVPMESIPENSNNYIRFAVKAEVQHRTEPFERAFSYVIGKYSIITQSWTSLIGAIIITLVSTLAIRSIFQPQAPPPVPDLVKVAGLAKAFEPLIYYSENGVQQVGDLQATGVAVWDLGESVLSTNMTSAPIIFKELDDLSESLKTLAIELTKFFANVDGDVDGILIVMDWAKRELSQLSNVPPSHLSTAFTNLHNLLSRIGVLESSNGTPTQLGRLATDLFGATAPQQTRITLQRTFTEFLSVLEEAISNELTHSVYLFSLFEAIDRQFLNLARTVIRESDHQERLESDLLASLWTRVLGSNSANLRKFEKNRQLLVNVREKTVRNKHILVDHNGKLMTLKANLETLRKKLVSPLVRSDNSSTLGVEDQIRGLDATYEHLRGVRERQKGKLMEMLYGAGSRRVAIGRDVGETWEIDGRRDR